MIPHKKIKDLIDAHANLKEPMTGAFWIHRDASEAWLVEVIPTIPDDDKVAEPTFFNPGIVFRFPLALIAGNRPNLEAALRRNPELARAIAEGADAEALVTLVRSLGQAA